MNSMVRRVARALSEANSGGDMCDYVEMAHAAVAAMREPTDAMCANASSPDSRYYYQAMIDAALVTS